MVGIPQQIIVVAQADTADALQEPGLVVVPADEHATDLAHGTESHAGDEVHSAFPPFDAAYFPGQLLWLALAFGALYLIMSRMALPRIGAILETRRNRIEGDLREAERLRQETEKAAAAYETALAEARRNAGVIAEETRTSIKLDIDNRRADVEAGLATRVAEAEARITADKNAALANVDGIAADTAQVLVAKLVGEVTASEAQAAVAAVSKE